MKVRTVARVITVALMGLAVLVATGDGFAQSYSGLYGWGLEHGLAGWKADSFPLMVDLFVGIGEMGLFLIAIDGHRLRKSLLSWLDLLLPASIAAAGWTASLIFNVGHTRHVFSYQATAAVPPLASMIGLLVLLRTLHRYVTSDSAQTVEISQRIPAVVDAAAAKPVFSSDADHLDDTPEALMRWFKGEDAVHPEIEVHLNRAREVFSDQLDSGQIPSVRRLKTALRIGQPKAKEVRALLTASASQ